MLFILLSLLSRFAFLFPFKVFYLAGLSVRVCGLNAPNHL